jgi:hypothetical protein
MLSENINHDFFKGDLLLEEDVAQSDGSAKRQRIGTLRALEIWLSQRYKSQDGADVAREILEPLRKIRDLRQKPAHDFQEEKYDRKYPIEQDKLLGLACGALTSLRLIFSSHPRAMDYKAPEWLDSDLIVFY